MNTGLSVPENPPVSRKWRDPDLIEAKPRPRNPLIRLMDDINFRAARDIAMVGLLPQAIITILPDLLAGLTTVIPETAGILLPLSGMVRAGSPGLRAAAAGWSSTVLFGKNIYAI